MSATVNSAATAITVRFAGFGGQGIIKAGEILGTAAVAEGRSALQTESYGSSARGGVCTSDVILATGDIHEIEPDVFDVLVVLSQDSCRAFLGQLRPGGILVYEEELCTLPETYRGAGHPVPATRIAAQELGRRIVTNVVVLGFASAAADLVGREGLEQAVRRHVPPGTEELNLRALDEGWRRGLAARQRALGASDDGARPAVS